MNQYKRFYVCKLIFALMPHWGGADRFCSKLRVRMLRWAGVSIGKNANISASVVFRGVGKVSFGDNVTIGAGVRFNVFGEMRFGDNVTIGEDAYFQSQGQIWVGDDVEIQNRTLVVANGGSHVTVGSHCRIAHMVSMKTSEHEIDPFGASIGGTTRFRDIAIKDGCWVCAGAVIIPGVTIERMSVVAAGAVVTKDAPGYSLVAGVPASVKKTYQKGCPK